MTRQMISQIMYDSFDKLLADKKEGIHFRRDWRDRGSEIAIISPHAGGIEPGTGELTRAIAGEEFSFYIFEVIQSRGNETLHIESTKFDDPDCIDLLARSHKALTIHGCKDQIETASVGGRDSLLRDKIIIALYTANFNAKIDSSNHGGTHLSNLCNRCSSHSGVQIEITESLRKTFFRGLNRRGREHPTEKFSIFVKTIRQLLMEHYKMKEPTNHSGESTYIRCLRSRRLKEQQLIVKYLKLPTL